MMDEHKAAGQPMAWRTFVFLFFLCREARNISWTSRMYACSRVCGPQDKRKCRPRGIFNGRRCIGAVSFWFPHAYESYGESGVVSKPGRCDGTNKWEAKWWARRTNRCAQFPGARKSRSNAKRPINWSQPEVWRPRDVASRGTLRRTLDPDPVHRPFRREFWWVPWNSGRQYRHIPSTPRRRASHTCSESRAPRRPSRKSLQIPLYLQSRCLPTLVRKLCAQHLHT